MHPQGVLFIARCTATLGGDELVLTMPNSTEYSRIPIDDGIDPPKRSSA